MEKTTQDGDHFFGKKSVIQKIKTVFIDIWISQVFSYFVTWMESKHGWRLYDNLDYWIPHFDRFAEAIRVKVEHLSDQELNFLPGEFRVALVTDCCNQIVSRPGSGPIRDGVGAPRADPAGWVQRVFYNGWLASYGMKYGCSPDREEDG